MGGGGGFHGGGFSHGGGMASFSHAAPSRSFSAPRSGGFSHGGGMASFSHASPNHSFNAQRGFERGSVERGSFAHNATPAFNRRTGEPRSYAAFHHGGEAFHNHSAANANVRGMEAPRGGTEAANMHREGRYGSMEHGNAVARPDGQPGHYGRDARGFGTRPSNWNQRPHNFDRSAYQRNVTAGQHFHYGSYDRPHGWYYRRWSYGDYLPGIFWARNYWLTSWWMFDLAMPPYGYEWVRYGDDAILVNVDTGQILQVEYGVFY